jgi:hypothetical protein
MRRKPARLAFSVAIVLAGSLVATAIGNAAAPTATAHLYAKAGPVKMHATLTLTGPLTGAKAIGALSNCVVQPSSRPRSGVADKIVCKNAAGQRVVVQMAPTSSALAYTLANSSSHMSLQSMTVEIRHGATVLFTLTASTGTLTVTASETAALLSGHDTLYVHAGTHTYQGKIFQVK